MYTPTSRVILIAVASVVALYVWPIQRWTAAMLIAGACMICIGHFRAGTVSLAFRALKAGDITKAASLLDRIKRPEWLSRQNRAYYHFAKGTLYLENTSGAEAAAELAMAGALGLRTENDRCLLMVYQAGAALLNKDLIKAEEYLAAAKGLKGNQGTMALIARTSEEVRKATAK